MPPELAEDFGKKYNMDSDEIKKNLYRKDNPNTYLASFAEFIFSKRHSLMLTVFNFDF
jgi:hypothetical protein